MSDNIGTDQKLANPDEIPLEDIDRILEEDDPGFAQELDDVKAAAEDGSDVEIESIEIDENSLGTEVEDNEEDAPYRRSLLGRVPVLRSLAKLPKNLKTNFKAFLSRFIEWLRFGPKEYLLFFLSRIKVLLKGVLHTLKIFQAWPLTKKIGLLALILVGASGLMLLKWNLKGTWIPAIDKPLLKDYSSVADQVHKLEDPQWIPLYQALRQPEHRYLFDKVVVNLKRSEFDPDSNPMGLFEFYVELDSKDTAIEVKSRELELLDLLQRTVEGETYGSLSGEAGKQRLKNLIRQEINQVLNRGWVKDVYISNVILKP